MRIRKISFTGSTSTGQAIQQAAARSNLKRVTLELGGKSPAVIFEDANLDNALTWTTNAILARSGQVCVAATRLYVHESVSEQFIAMYIERMKAAVAELGDPQDMSVNLGPLVDQVQFERVKGMIERGAFSSSLRFISVAQMRLDNQDLYYSRNSLMNHYIHPNCYHIC
jgi:acyl-CoA reductase-like NAD-dependent aldehyde dehydrogenase